MKKHIALAAVAASIVFQTGCTAKDNAGTVKVTMPSTSMSSSKVVSGEPTTGKAWNADINPVAANEINCFAVFVGGGDLNLNSFTYRDPSGTLLTERFGRHLAFIPAGKSAELIIPTGDRVFHVLGLYASVATACGNSADKASTIESGNLSEPFLIASQRATITSGDNSLKISPVFDSSKKVLSINFFDSQSSTPLYGDGRDGSIVSTGTATPVTGGSSLMSNASYTRPSLGSVANSKYFASSRRVVAIDRSLGRLITLGGAFASAEFEPGDEIVWYVAGGNTSVAGATPDSDVNGACGGKLYIGSYGTSKVQSVVGGTQLMLEKPISQSPSTIRATTTGAPTSSSDFCLIVVSRVSSFDSITVRPGETLNLATESFNYATGTGGVLMIRAGAVTIGAGSTLTIDGTGKGYTGGMVSGPNIYQGDSVNSLGKNISGSNYGGGGPGSSSTIGGGGGAHAGTGGLGANGVAGGTGAGGHTISHCNGICTPFAGYKSFFGSGGGGAGSSAVGGSGGAIVILYAGTINGDGALNIYAKGAAGTSGSAGSGGGAGGTIGVHTKSNGAALYLYTNGGAGGSGTAGGAGGGGGVIELVRCETASQGAANLSVGGGLGSGGAGSGGIGFTASRNLCQ